MNEWMAKTDRDMFSLPSSDLQNIIKTCFVISIEMTASIYWSLLCSQHCANVYCPLIFMKTQNYTRIIMSILQRWHSTFPKETWLVNYRPRFRPYFGKLQLSIGIYLVHKVSRRLTSHHRYSCFRVPVGYHPEQAPNNNWRLAHGHLSQVLFH